MSLGVYNIINVVNGKRYIGSSKDCFKRLRQHIYRLDHGNHHCRPLQYSYNKYGIDAFSFQIVHLCDSIHEAHASEESLLQRWYGTENCYNLSPLAKLPFTHKHFREKALQTALTSEKYKQSHRDVCLKRNADPLFIAKLKQAIRNSAKHKEATSKNARTILQRPDVIAKNREALKNSVAQKNAARKVAAYLNTPEMKAKNLQAISCKVIGTNIDTGEKVIFESQSAAARWASCSSTNISMCCCGKQKQAKGYVWEKKLA